MYAHARHWTFGIALLACVACDATDSAPPGPTIDPAEEREGTTAPVVSKPRGSQTGSGAGADAASPQGSGADPISGGPLDGGSLPNAADAAGDAFATLSEAGLSLLDAGTLPPGTVSDAGTSVTSSDGSANPNGG